MREVLIAVAGTTPAVVTETVWHLARTGVELSEVQVLTTERGKEAIEEALFVQGHWQRLCRDYGLHIDFDPRRVHVLEDADGHPMRDIRTREENGAAGDYIVRFLRQQAADDSARLHCSVAGGRKTMSVLLAFALQLCGRPQDQLLHVLVSPPELERCRDFFYPPVEERGFAVDGRIVSSREIAVEVATVPFVRLGHLLGSHQRRWLQQDYSALVAQTQRHLDDIRLCLDLDARQVRFFVADQAERKVELRLGEKKSRGSHLTALQAAYYALIVLQTKGHPLCRHHDSSALLEKLYAHFYRAGQKKKTELIEVSASTQSQMRKNIESALAEKFLPEVTARVQVESRTERIPLDPSRIEIRGSLD